MKDKILSAILDMKSMVERDDRHIYRSSSGQKYQGVSTVSSVVPKDWLSAWGAKEAVKALGYSDYPDRELAVDIWSKIKGFGSVEEYVSLLKEAKGASGRKSRKALVDGTAGHKWLENLVERRINGQEAPPIPLNTPLERPIMQFMEWEKNVGQWIASEALVVNPERKYAGQLDAICILKTGELCLVDFKFASNISEDYYLQTAGYQACFEFYGVEFDKRLIIRLPKTLEKEEWNPKTFSYSKIPNNIEVFVAPNKYKEDRDAFYASLVVKRWINLTCSS